MKLCRKLANIDRQQNHVLSGLPLDESGAASLSHMAQIMESITVLAAVLGGCPNPINVG
jgi:hypothetical protein